jgi:hypothetical protein
MRVLLFDIIEEVSPKKGGTPYGASGRMLGGSLRKVYMVGLMQVGNY